MVVDLGGLNFGAMQKIVVKHFLEKEKFENTRLFTYKSGSRSSMNAKPTEKLILTLFFFFL
jgi:hypothetical protein